MLTEIQTIEGVQKESHRWDQKKKNSLIKTKIRSCNYFDHLKKGNGTNSNYDFH